MSPDFETERLRLRQFNLNDFEFILTLLNSPGWLRFIGERDVRTEPEAKSYLQNGPIESYNRNGFGLYLVELKSSLTPIGMCGLVKREVLPQPDLGFAFLTEYTRSGYAFESASAMVDRTISETKLTTLYGVTDPKNVDSKKLLLKLGFSFEKQVKLAQKENVSDLFARQLVRENGTK